MGLLGLHHNAQSMGDRRITAPATASLARTFRQCPTPLLVSKGCQRRCRRSHRVVRVFAGPRTAPKEEWWNKNCPDNMREISSVQQFVDELADTGDNLIIVDFFAKWCHACRALFPKLCQICRDNPEMKLLKVDWDENKDIAKPLGVRVLPYFQLYRGAEGKVAEFSCSVAKIQRMRDAINANQAARCSLGLNPTLKETFPDLKPSHEMERHEMTILDSTGDSVLSQSIASFDEETQTPAASTPASSPSAKETKESRPERPVASSVVNKY